MSAELDGAVRAVVRDCLGVASGEEVLIVCNPATEGLGASMRGEAQEVGADMGKLRRRGVAVAAALDAGELLL